MGDDKRVVYSTESGWQGDAGKTSKPKGKAPPAAPAIKNSAKQGVRVGRESKGRGGKTVTVVHGLTLAEAALSDLLKRMKNQLGTGGALKGGTLEIQGDHRDKVLQFLEKEGIKAKATGG